MMRDHYTAWPSSLSIVMDVENPQGGLDMLSVSNMWRGSYVSTVESPDCSGDDPAEFEKWTLRTHKICTELSRHITYNLAYIPMTIFKSTLELENTRDVFAPPAHPTIAIFELGFPFDPGTMPWKFRDDISNGSRVLTDKQTEIRIHKQTTLKTIRPSLRCAARVVTTVTYTLQYFHQSVYVLPRRLGS